MTGKHWPKTLPYRRTGERRLRLDIHSVGTQWTTYTANPNSRWYDTPTGYEIWTRMNGDYIFIQRVNCLAVRYINGKRT